MLKKLIKKYILIVLCTAIVVELLVSFPACPGGLIPGTLQAAYNQDGKETYVDVAENEMLQELLDGSSRKFFPMLLPNSKDEGALQLKARGHNGKEYIFYLTPHSGYSYINAGGFSYRLCNDDVLYSNVKSELI